MFESGLIIEEVIDFCKDAKEYGVDVLNISRRNIITDVFVKKQECLQCLVDISILLNLLKRY